MALHRVFEEVLVRFPKAASSGSFGHRRPTRLSLSMRLTKWQDCQKSSWTSCHRLECKIFAKLHPNVLPNNVRAIVRLLQQQKVKLLRQGEWDQLMGLEAHIDKLRKAGGERWQNLCLMTKAAKEYSGSTLDEHTILGLFCRVSRSTLWCSA